MKTAIIAIGTGASNITESVIFDRFGFDLSYFQINRMMLINKEKISIDSIVKQIRKNDQKIILFSTLGGICCNTYISQVTKVLMKNKLKYDAIVTTPFLWEGEQKRTLALNSLNNIVESCNSISIFNNENLLNYNPEATVMEAYNWMDEQIVKLIELSLGNKLEESSQSNTDFPLILIHNLNGMKFI